MTGPTSPEQPWPVRTVARKIAEWVDKLGAVWVEGQLAQVTARPGTGTAFLVLRDPAAVPGPDLPGRLTELELPQDLDRRAVACACYATQLGFQFGGAAAMRTALAGLPEVLLAGDRARALVA